MRGIGSAGGVAVGVGAAREEAGDQQRRQGIGWVVAAGLLLALTPASAEEVDTEHLFGFTQGTDIGDKGDRELELETHGRFGKRGGGYSGISAGVEGKFTVSDHFRVSPGVGLSYHDISGVPGLDDRRQWALEGSWVELKYRALDRHTAPFGLTFGLTPGWSRIAPASGERADGYGVGFLASADKELLGGQMFAAVNLTYDPAVVRPHATGVWTRESAFGVSGALAAQIAPGVYVGGELRHERAYEGLTLNQFAGSAWTAGPTFYARLNSRAWIGAGWLIQFAGGAAGDAARLDLINFERHQIAVRLGYAF